MAGGRWFCSAQLQWAPSEEGVRAARVRGWKEGGWASGQCSACMECDCAGNQVEIEKLKARMAELNQKMISNQFVCAPQNAAALTTRTAHTPFLH